MAFGVGLAFAAAPCPVTDSSNCETLAVEILPTESSSEEALPLVVGLFAAAAGAAVVATDEVAVTESFTAEEGPALCVWAFGADDAEVLGLAAGDGTVAIVVATLAALGACPMAPAAGMLNDPIPQRHEQSHEPSALVVPAPATIAPGEPTTDGVAFDGVAFDAGGAEAGGATLAATVINEF